MAASDPSRDCPACPRLADFRLSARRKHPDWHNAPVASFGAPDAAVLIVGLAPGLNGANRTGRPFTGDWAGLLLYATLIEYGFAHGHYAARPDDGLTLDDCRITNAVRCVPPANKPVPAEITTCRAFLRATIAEMPRLRGIVALGRVAHESVLRAFGRPLARHPFGHGAEHALASNGLASSDMDLQDPAPLTLFDSYHCSRYNTNTGVLTPAMFHAVFARLRAFLKSSGEG